MKILRFDDDRIGVLSERGVVDISDLIPDREARGPQRAMETLIVGFEHYRTAIDERVARMAARALSDVALLAPLPRPGVVMAAFSNYLDRPGRTKADVAIDFFHKSPHLVGPGGRIELHNIPSVAEHQAEAELAFIIGATCSKASGDDWRRYVFGYVPFFDVSARGLTRRSLLIPKAQDTFSVCGPWITTADEIEDPHDLQIRSWINGALRQNYNTNLMAHTIPDQIAWLSRYVTLDPGDVVATGVCHEGLAAINPGDDLRIAIDGLGEASFRVVGDSPPKSGGPQPGQGPGMKVSPV
jgi:2-keto-4-pentenoate hydratase/2-oxohepta-3-ene-1,7-dioic acid hydratase in catechol pathway